MTQWQKMTPEQQQAQMARNTYYRHKRKAAELGISMEEYQKNLSQKPVKKVKAARPASKPIDDKEDWGWTQADNSHMGDEVIVKSDLRPWLWYVMKRTKMGEFIGYKTTSTIVDENLKAELDKENLEL